MRRTGGVPRKDCRRLVRVAEMSDSAVRVCQNCGSEMAWEGT